MNSHSTLKAENSQTERMSKSNYSSHISQRSMESNNPNNKNKKYTISQEKFAPSPSLSPDVRLYKPKNLTKVSYIREFYNPKLKSKTQIHSRNVSNQNGSNNINNINNINSINNVKTNQNVIHIRTKSGFSLNFN
jgi:hypothetical protein